MQKFYLEQLRGRKDFRYSHRGLRADIDQELLVIGDLARTKDKLVMNKPRMLIGSDRMELYEFLARRKEMWA